MGAMMMGVGALASGGSALAGLFGGDSHSANNVQLPQMWQNPYQQQYADQSMSLMQGLNGANVPQQLLPQYQQQVSNIMNDPTQHGAMAGAQQGGNMMQQGGQNQFNYGQLLANTGMQALPYANNVAQTAFDPQNALYDRTRQQVSDQTNADLSARGVATTPYGAGVAVQANNNFNMDWQNNQLGRQTQGAGAIGQILNTGGAAMGAGGTMQQAGAGAVGAGGLLPYSTSMGIDQNNLAALGAYSGAGTQATQLPLAQIQDYIAMMNSGNQSNAVANSTAGLALQQQNQGFNQGQTMGQNFGNALSSLSNNTGFWNNMGGGGGYSQRPLTGADAAMNKSLFPGYGG